MRRSRFLSASVAVMLAAGMGLSACSKKEPAATTSPSATPTATSTVPPKPTGGTVEVSGAITAAPKVKMPKPFAVDKTTVHVVHKGGGVTVGKNDLVRLDYVGLDGASSKEFGSSWSRNQTAVFSLTTGALMPGLMTGLLGQQIGSRVEIEVPPAQGYGPEGGNSAAGIGATDTIVFVVDLRAVTRPLAKISAGKNATAPGFPKVKITNGLPTGFAPLPGKVAKARSHVLITGTGPKVKSGQTIKFDYLAGVAKTGKVFDTTFGKQPATVALDKNLAIAGMAAQLVGKRAGSRVELVLPKGLAQSGQLPPGVTDKNVTIVFSVDILGAI